MDEHPRCQDWAREGQCVLAPFFMAHTCRESCGVCGFLSPLNTEIQNNNGDTYSDFTDTNSFDCGRVKRLCDINGEDCNVAKTTTTPVTPTTPSTKPAPIRAADFDIRTIDPSDIFFSSDPDAKKQGEVFCGGTVVADRWVVAASHCYDDFRNGVSPGSPRRARVNIVRDNTPYREVVEIKRVYKHPNYRFPNLYNDVAVLELGRRIEYNFTKFGDSPICLPEKGLKVINKIATVQGYGVTETGTKGDLLEANVTVITNQYCKQILQANVTNNENARRKILKALPLGLDYGLLCAQGIYQPDKGIHTAQCAFCQVGWPCGQKLKSKNTLSDGKKIFLRPFFLCCFRKKTLKLVSLFIFRH